MLIHTKILIAHEASHRYIGGDLDKAYLMLVKERLDDGWYDDGPIARQLAQISIRDGDAQAARKVIQMRNRHQYEYVSEATLEEAAYLKPCPDITARARELSKGRPWILFNIHPIKIDDYIADGVEPPHEKDYCYITYEINYDYGYVSNSITKSYLQEFFGDVKVDYYPQCQEIEVYRK